MKTLWQKFKDLSLSMKLNIILPLIIAVHMAICSVYTGFYNHVAWWRVCLGLIVCALYTLVMIAWFSLCDWVLNRLWLWEERIKRKLK